MNRKSLFVLLKVVVVTAAVFWLGRTVDLKGMGQVLARTDLGFLSLALFLGLLPALVSGFRSHTLLKTLGIPISQLSLTCIAQIGQFFAVLVPGIIGDDGARFFYLSKLNPGRVRQACSTVLLDRALGFASLFILTTICIPLNWEVLARRQSTLWVGISFLAAGSCMLSIVITALLLSRARLEAILDFFRNRFSHSKLVGELTDITSAFVGNKKALCIVMTAALLTQIAICVLFWSVGRAVGIPLPLLSWMSFVPVIVVSGVLPITFAGIGVRDYLLFLFVGAATGEAIEKERIAALCLLLLILTFQGAILGGLVYLGFKPASSGATAPEPTALKK